MAATDSYNESESSSRSRTKGFVTKRAHKKSRAGCHGCKQRKIKCDEIRPQCTYCKTRMIQCIYGGDVLTSQKSQSSDDLPIIMSSSRSGPCRTEQLPNSPESSLSLFPGWHANDVLLLHHYSTLTSNSLVLINRHGADRVVKFEIPTLAFDHDFLMHCVLGVASLHLRHLAPNVPEYQSLTVAHRLHAIRGLRLAISELSQENCRAILAASLYLLILSSDLSTVETGNDLWIGNWLGLWAGMRETIKVLSWTFVEQSGLAPIFARDNKPQSALVNLPIALSDMLLLMEPDSEGLRTIFGTLSCLSRLYQHLLDKGLTQEFAARVIAWPASTEIEEFAALVKRKQPQALIIAAYYLVFTKLVDEIWWTADIVNHEIKNIANALPTEDHSLMVIPLQAVYLQNKWDVASLLLSQLPGGSTFEFDSRIALDPIWGSTSVDEVV